MDGALCHDGGRRLARLAAPVGGSDSRSPCTRPLCAAALAQSSLVDAVLRPACHHPRSDRNPAAARCDRIHHRSLSPFLRTRGLADGGQFSLGRFCRDSESGVLAGELNGCRSRSASAKLTAKEICSCPSITASSTIW